MFRLIAVLLVATTAFAQSPVDSLVTAERAFAKKSYDTNVREAFLAYFTDDGVIFTPAPANAKQTYSKRAAPPNPPPITLNWEPIFADVSKAGDLGYTTGPFTVTDNAKKTVAGQGFFFSVWKTQPDGNWKVVLDFGIDTPPLPDHSEPILQTQVSNSKEKPIKLRGASWKKRKQELLYAEQQFSQASQSKGVAAAYSQSLDSHARLNRNGMFPLIEQKSIHSHLETSDSKTKWIPIGSDVSESGEIGYVYGSYDRIGNPEKGHYARVWQRDSKGQWKIVIDTARGTDEKN